MKKFIFLLFSNIFLLAQFSFGQETLTTNAATSIGETTATLNASGETLNSSYSYGVKFFYNTSSPSDGFGSSSGFSSTVSDVISASFVLNISSLTSGQIYYFKSELWVNDGGGWVVEGSVGSELNFTTISLTAPSVTTDAASNIAQTTVTLNGEVTADGGAAITARGVCYSTATSPDLTDSYTTGGTAVDSYSHEVTSLTAGTTYYIRAYATNSVETSYGSETNFTTLKNTPTAQASGVTFTNIASTTMTVSWTRAGTGGGDYCLLVAEAAGDVNSPSDGTDYTASSAFGSGTPAISGTGTSYAIFKGTETSVNVTGLTAGTSYTFKVFEFNNTGTNTKYYVADGTDNPDSQTTSSAEPTTQAHTITFSSLQTTTMTIGWTDGNGSNRIVAVSDVGGATSPSDNTEYSASADWNSKGTQLGSSDYYTVYNGASSSVSLTNLSANTTYYVRVFEYNGNAGSENYYSATATSNPNDTTTLKIEPSSQATSISFSSIAETMLTATWVRGGGDSVIVIAKQGSAVSDYPVDNNYYAANPAFGSGDSTSTGNYVVYRGTGNSVNVTALTGGNNYHFRAFEFNNGGTKSNYLTISATGNPNDIITLAGEPTTQASTITFSGIQTNQLTATASGGNGENRIILAKQGSPVTGTPVDGTGYTGTSSFGTGQQIGTGNYVVSAGTNAGVTVTNLLENTHYYFKIFEYNNTGSNSNYKTDGFNGGNPNDTLTIKSAPSIQASSLTFSNIASTTMDLIWTRGDGDSVMIVAKAGSTLTETPTAGTAYNPDPIFSSGDPIGGGYVIYTGTGTGVSISGLTASSEYTFKAFEFTNSEPYTNYLNSDGTNNPQTQFTVGTEPTTQASEIIFSNTQSNQVTLAWTSGNGANRLVLAHQGAAVDASPIDGFAYTANSIYSTGNEIGTDNYVVYNSSGSGITITNLLPETTYHFRVFEYSGTGTATNYFVDAAINNPNDITTLIGKPNIQASNIVYTSLNTTSYTIDWTDGDGDGVIIVGKAAVALTEVPTDGVSYTPNLVYSSGEDIGNGNRVVYDGVGTGGPITVTGLSVGTEYTFKVFAYNTISTSPYYQDADATNNPVSQYTLASEPSSQGAFSAITSYANSLDVPWTDGDGLGRIILAKEAGPVDAFPIDGSTYTGNIAFGTGDEIGTGNYVVYAGTGTNTINVSDLLGSTTYHFQIFEYNNSGAINYRTSDGPITNGTTSLLDVPTVQASAINFTNYGTDSITINWTNGDGENRLVAVKEGVKGSITNPTNATTYAASTDWDSKGIELGGSYYTVYNGSGSSVKLTNLSVDTEYWVQIFEYNNPSSSALYLSTTSATNPLNDTTLKIAPSNQATLISLDNIKSNSIDVSYTNGIDGENRIVVARETSTTNVLPTNFTVYAANTAFGSGDITGTGNYVVYNGAAGGSVSVTGLTGGTAYTFIVYDYNNEGASAIYNTTIAAANSDAATTLGTATWNGTTSNWNTAANWTPTSIPSSSQGVIIPSGESAYPDITTTEIVDNMTIASEAFINISSTGNLTVTNSILLENSGAATPSGMLVIPGSGSFSAGNSTMELYHPFDSVHFVSFPTTSASMSVFTGNFAVKEYDEPNANFVNLFLSDGISVGHGYAANVRTANRTLSFSGTFNNNLATTIAVTNAFPGDGNFGWNLVGNPYPSAIDWNALSGWTKTNVDNTAYYYNGSNGTYASWNGSSGSNGGTRYIAPGQGFFVHASADGFFGMANAVRVSNQQSFWKKANTDIPLLRLQATNTETSTDIAVVFMNEATENFDTEFDAYKWYSTNLKVADLYTLLNNEVALSINALNSSMLTDIDELDYTIPLGFTKGIDGNITLEASEIENIPESIYIYLYDSKENKYINLRKNSYSFYINSKTNDRFTIILSKMALGIENTEISNPDFLIYMDKNIAFVKSEAFLFSTGEIDLIDITGKVILSRITSTARQQEITVNKSGIYIVKVIINNKVITQKVVVQ